MNPEFYSITLIAVDESGNISEPVTANTAVITDATKGDYNLDNEIDYLDLLGFSGNWHIDRTMPGYNNMVDFDDDRTIDDYDFDYVFMGKWD